MIVISPLWWFLFLLVPFVISVVIHFIIPLQFIKYSSLQSQEVYNGYRIESQQTSIRTLTILSGKLMQDRIQVYESIRNQLTTILQRKPIYQTTNPTHLTTNYAGDLAQTSSHLIFQSMWYAPGITKLSDMSEDQQYVYSKYLEVQPFIRVSLGSQNVNTNFVELEVILDFYGTPLLLCFPSVNDPIFLDSNLNIYSDMYNKSIQNWKVNNLYKYSTFIKNEKMYVCNVLIDYVQQQEIPLGVTCLKIKLKYLFTELTSLGVQTYKYSTNIYYIITPIYSMDTFPQILFNFTDNNLTNVSYPTNQYFYTNSDANKLLLTPQSFQKISITSITKSVTHFKVPIVITDSKTNLNTILYIVAKSTFKGIDFDNQRKTAKIFNTILIPSIVLIIVSILISIIVIRCLILSLESSLQLLSSNCKHILMDGVDLKFPHFDETSDLKLVFQKISIINQLHQVSSQNLYAGTQPQKLLKYFKIYILFERLNYNLGDVVEMIGNCHYNMKEYVQADKYFDKAVKISIREIQKQHGPFHKFLKQKKFNTVDDSSIKQLQRRILKLIKCKIWQIQIGQKSQVLHFIRLLKNVVQHKISKSCSSSDILIILLEVRYYLKIGRLKLAGAGLKKAQKLLALFSAKLLNCQNNIEDQLFIPPQILKSYLLLFKGLLRVARKQIPAAFKIFSSALETNILLPSLYNKIIQQLFSLSGLAKLNTKFIENSQYFLQLKLQSKQYLFLFDWTRNQNVSRESEKLQTNQIINQAARILKDYIQGNDRLSIIIFAAQYQIISSLTKKQKNEQTLKRLIQGLMKIKRKRKIANVTQTFQQAVFRIRKLICPKVIIIFKRPHTSVSPKELQNILCKRPDIKLFLISLNQQTKFSHSLLTINISSRQDIDRIIMMKRQSKITNKISVF